MIKKMAKVNSWKHVSINIQFTPVSLLKRATHHMVYTNISSDQNYSCLFIYLLKFLSKQYREISKFELGIREITWWAAPRPPKSETEIKKNFEWKISLNCLIVAYFQRVLRIMHDNFIKLNHNDFCNVMQIWN